MQQWFRVSFIQSDLVEICDKFTSYKCETHTRGSNMQVLQKFDIDFKERIKIALLNFHNTNTTKVKVSCIENYNELRHWILWILFKTIS